MVFDSFGINYISIYPSVPKITDDLNNQLKKNEGR